MYCARYQRVAESGEMPLSNPNAAKDPHGRPQRSPSLGDGLLFVFSVYGLSRLFYLVIGAVLAACLNGT